MSAAAGTLVIFDCDGVLVDSERLVIDIDVAAVTAAGWPVTREQAIEAFVGSSNADVVAMIEAQVGHPRRRTGTRRGRPTTAACSTSCWSRCRVSGRRSSR